KPYGEWNMHAIHSLSFLCFCMCSVIATSSIDRVEPVIRICPLAFFSTNAHYNDINNAKRSQDDTEKIDYHINKKHETIKKHRYGRLIFIHFVFEFKAHKDVPDDFSIRIK